MSTALGVALVNAVTATILACGVLLAGRLVKRPAIVHGMWIVVLLELFTPPVLEIGLLPTTLFVNDPVILGWTVPSPSPLAAPARQGAQNAGGGSDRSWGTSLPPAAAIGRTRLPLVEAAWLIGSFVVLGLFLARARRFRRAIAMAETEDDALDRRLARLASRMGIPKPKLRLVRGRISPLVWPAPGGVELVFPAALARRLTADERDAVLAHELAHVARKDHWVRGLELLAVAGFWWNPVVWWARRRLRLAEERACDHLVLSRMPDHRPSYALGLLKTVEFLSGTARRIPALACGVGEVRELEDRLTMIMKDRPAATLSNTSRLLLTLAASALLLVFPTWAELGPAAAVDETPDGNHRLEAAEARLRNELLDLERQARELEDSLSAVRQRQIDLEHEWRETLGSDEQARIRTEAEAARAAGREAEAREMYERARALAQAERRTELESRRARLEHEEIRELRSAARAYQRAVTAAQLDEMRSRLLRLREAGELEQADALESELSVLREAERREQGERERTLDLQRLQQELEIISRQAAEFEAEGRTEEGLELELRELRRRLDLERAEVD